MNELVLQFAWQHQYLHHGPLHTTSGDTITVLNPGFKNVDEGPDFLNAKIRIGTIEWVGSVEIHLKSSGWIAHKHKEHPLYNSVILHVVYENDVPIQAHDGGQLPTLELASYLPKGLLEKCKELMHATNPLACQAHLHNVPIITQMAMIDRAATQRLERKATQFLTQLRGFGNDWEAASYAWIVQSFGFKINQHGFEVLSNKVPYKVLSKISHNQLHVEALLFGMAGFLQSAEPDAYSLELRSEFKHLHTKWLPETEPMGIQEWKFLRLRPANFPTLRIAQLAALLHRHSTLVSCLIEAADVASTKALFSIVPSEYWHTHYSFGKNTPFKNASFGAASVDYLLINCVSVLLAAYALYKDNQLYMDRAISILEAAKAEQNHICDLFLEHDFQIRSAYESQGCVELYNSFCTQKKCLDCMIGHRIIQGKSVANHQTEIDTSIS